MNKEYALEILDMVERGTLERDASLAKEAFRYLKNLKNTPVEILDRIHRLTN